MTKVYSGISLADLEEEVKGKRIETISQQPQREDSREISSLETAACLPVLLPVLLEYASIGIALQIFFEKLPSDMRINARINVALLELTLQTAYLLETFS